MQIRGRHVIYLVCRCGHRAELDPGPIGIECVGEDISWPHRLRCSACGRRGRPESLTVSWGPVVEVRSAAYITPPPG